MPKKIACSIALLLIAACRAPTGTHDWLEGTTWTLTSLRGAGVVADDPGGAPTLRLDAAGTRASGYGGCSDYGGTYRLSGAALRFGDLTATLRACQRQALNQQEGAFFQALADTRGWRRDGAGLVLVNEAGELARFAAGAP